MARLKPKEIKAMQKKDYEEKLKELRLALIKSNVEAMKGGAKRTKEIKKTIARILTLQ